MTAWALGIQDGQALWRHEDFDAARDARLAADEACAFEGEDHLMDRGWRDAEVALQLVFGGRAAMDTVYASMKARYWPCLGVKLGVCLPDI